MGKWQIRQKWKEKKWVTQYRRATVITMGVMCCHVFLSPFPIAAWSKAKVCGRLPAEIVGSNPARGMDVCLLCVVR
jgi:hypothetical protein